PRLSCPCLRVAAARRVSCSPGVAWSWHPAGGRLPGNPRAPPRLGALGGSPHPGADGPLDGAVPAEARGGRQVAALTYFRRISLSRLRLLRLFAIPQERWDVQLVLRRAGHLPKPVPGRL